MKRRMTAVLAIGAVLGMTGCGNFPEIMDETVATTQAAQETTSSCGVRASERRSRDGSSFS